MPPDEINEEWQRQCENEERMIEEEARGSGMTELIKCECGLIPYVSYIVIKPNHKQYRVECWGCDKKTLWYDSEAEAIEAWNRRGEEK